MSKRKKGRSHSHFGLDFVMTNGEEEIEEAVKALERKRNRRERIRGKSVKKLQGDLRDETDEGKRARILDELNFRFSKMRNLNEGLQ
ncbi:MAG: hypothetical protein ACOC5G_04130 [Acidobacteriota bacterium]